MKDIVIGVVDTPGIYSLAAIGMVLFDGASLSLEYYRDQD